MNFVVDVEKNSIKNAFKRADMNAQMCYFYRCTIFINRHNQIHETLTI